MESKSELEAMAIEFSNGYLFEHKNTAKEAYSAGLIRCQNIIEQMETALEVCNQERKKHRDEADFANAAYAKLQKEYESLLGASSLLL